MCPYTQIRTHARRGAYLRERLCTSTYLRSHFWSSALSPAHIAKRKPNRGWATCQPGPRPPLSSGDVGGSRPGAGGCRAAAMPGSRGTDLRGRNRIPTREERPGCRGSGEAARPPSALEFNSDTALGPVLPLRGAAPRSPALPRLLLDRGRRPAPAGSTCAGGKATFPPRPFPGGNQSSLLFPVSLRSLPFVPRYLSLPGIRAAPRWLGEGRAVAKISHLKTTMESFRPARVVPELYFRAGGRELFALLLFSQQNSRASYRRVASSPCPSPWPRGTGQGHPAHLRRHSAFGRIHQKLPGSQWLREAEALPPKSYPALQSVPCSEVSWTL